MPRGAANLRAFFGSFAHFGREPEIRRAVDPQQATYMRRTHVNERGRRRRRRRRQKCAHFNCDKCARLSRDRFYFCLARKLQYLFSFATFPTSSPPFSPSYSAALLLRSHSSALLRSPMALRSERSLLLARLRRGRRRSRRRLNRTTQPTGPLLCKAVKT